LQPVRNPDRNPGTTHPATAVPRPTKAEGRRLAPPSSTTDLSGAAGSGRKDVRLRQLSPARRRLLDLLQSIGFGRIEALRIVDREPVLSPPPRILRSIKLGGDARPGHEPTSENYVLKKPLRDLFDELDRLGTGLIVRLDLKDGLPCSLVIEEGTGLPQQGGAA
jgi:hypothetical protein